MISHDDPEPILAPSSKGVSEWFAGMCLHSERTLNQTEFRFVQRRQSVWRISAIVGANVILCAAISPVGIGLKLAAVAVGALFTYLSLRMLKIYSDSVSLKKMKIFAGVPVVLPRDGAQLALFIGDAFRQPHRGTFPASYFNPDEAMLPNSVEVIAGGNYIWRVDHTFPPVMTHRLSGAIVKVADRSDDDPYQLLPAELEELEGYIAQHLRFEKQMWLTIAFAVLLFVIGAAVEFIVLGVAALGGAMIMYLMQRNAKRQRLALQLATVGELKSSGEDPANLQTVNGLEWLVNDHPAAWRLTRDTSGLVTPLAVATAPSLRRG